MRKFFLSGALVLSLAACGQQEKAESPFADMSKFQKEPPPVMSDSSFTRYCESNDGTLNTKPSGEVYCAMTSKSLEFGHDERDADEEGRPPNGKKTVRKEMGESAQKYFPLGNVELGSFVFGEVKGGFPVTFKIDRKTTVATLTEPRLPKTSLPKGKLEMLVYKGTYEYLRVTVIECVTKNLDKAGVRPTPCE